MDRKNKIFNQILCVADPDLGSGMNIPDLFSESLKAVLSAKIFKIFLCASGIFLTLDPG
jgi:hypothetical protein